MGIDRDPGMALAKALVSTGAGLPTSGHGVRLGRQSRQAGDRVPGEASGGPRVPVGRDERHRRRAGARRHPGRTRREGVGGTAQRGGAHPGWEGGPRDQHAVRARSSQRRLLHPHGDGDGGRAVHHDAPRRLRGRARHRGAPRRSERAAVAPGASRKRRAGARRRRGSRSRRRRPRWRARPDEARPGRDPVHATPRRVPLHHAGRAGDRRARAARPVPGHPDAGGPGVPAAPAFRRASGLATRGMGRHARVRRRSERPRNGVARERAGARVPGRDRTPREGVRVPEAVDELPPGGGGTRRRIALLPGAGADRASQTGRHDRGRRVPGARLQADRGQAAVADDPDRHRGRQPGRPRLGARTRCRRWWRSAARR